MKERPIIFSTTNIRALLDRQKTHTRRVIKPQPLENYKWVGWIIGSTSKKDVDKACWEDESDFLKHHYVRCPYGTGDRLWVKETWQALWPIKETPFEKINPRPDVCTLAFLANEQNRFEKFGGKLYTGKWRSARFMPKWASRITLEVTGIRVERVQDISIEDCIAEGIHDSSDLKYLKNSGIEKQEYCLLWNKINKSHGYGWDVNPWVWVIEFKLLEGCS